jgi:hypothetical protein
VSVKYAFIAGEEGNYPIYQMCRWAKVSRSGFYEWCGRAPSATAVRRGELAALVRFAFKHSEAPPGTGGSTPSWPVGATTSMTRQSDP